MESGAPRREGLLKLKFGTVCTSTLFARITVRLIELSVLWAHAAHTGTDFSFTRKVSKSVCKGLPLTYPLGEVSPAVTASGHAPPFLAGSFMIDEGERHEVTVGETSPLRRYQRGHFLFDTLLVPFLVKEKEPREWAA